ncbi:MAG: CorA family divalent cation transporter [Patescibacteria group bacterium]|nr:CorA family divalent cation transporter [Patescibacteria group bacterium]
MLTRYVQRDLTWIDLVTPTPGEVRALMREFDIDPLIAEELLVPSFKPKVERRGEMIYVILHFPMLASHGSRPEQEVDFIIGRHFLITARYGAVDPLHTFAKAFEVNSLLRHDLSMTHGGHLFATMAQNLYQALRYELEVLDRRLENIEEHIFTGDERKMVVEISQTGRTIHDFRQLLLPHQEMLVSLLQPATKLFGPEYAYYVRGIEGAFERVRGMLEHLRESLIELRETNNSLLSTKQNEIMKTFTVLAFITLPLTLITGIFGMNTRYTPLICNAGDFWIVIGMMMVVGIGFVAYFIRKGWL